MPKETLEPPKTPQELADHVTQAMASAFEWGFKCAEKGMNLEQAMQRFWKQMKGESHANS